MSKKSEYRMAIKIAGEIEKSLYGCTDLARKELNKIAREAAYASSITKDSLSKGIKDAEPFFEGLEKAGVKAFKAVAAAAAAAGASMAGIGIMSAEAGIEFESAFAGVKKTTNATAGEYEQMRKEILAMTREIPAAGTEIAEVAEAAGQLGIEKENLLDFTRTMIDMGESTNLSSTEAASALAKFANITNMDADDYGRLGSVVVDLGNNFATTEADIVGMATRLASSGELAGFTEAQIMAMSAAMSSVGIEAEAGGSAMSKMIKSVQVAVETGSKSLNDYADVAGVTAEEFKEAFKKDGLSAVAAFISGLNNVERNGKSATVILDEMGLTEVRLSNTLLSLANADELMYKAVTTANAAWEENAALTNEAAQRYGTTESRIAILKNGFKEMGIEISDQFNEPLREGIDIFTDLVHEVTAEMSGSNAIRDIAQQIINGVPTAIKITQELAQTVGSLADPLLSIGGWLVDNPTLLESAIAGIGTAIITYKVASGVGSLATSIAALGPAGWAVVGAGGALAAITGIGVVVKKSAEEAKKANLEQHFGNISLSMKELEETAKYIVDNGSLEQLQESVNALGELEGIDRSINKSVSELNRMNWKVSIGMNLKEEEQELYKQSIADYVSAIQRYVEEEQYAVNLAVGILTGDDLENSNIVTQLNEFYSGKNAELARLGAELNQTVTDAFNDGLLDIPEAKKISELQQQMADIKAGLAMGNYEANLDLLENKYMNQEIDADTFMNLQAELNEQAEIARQNYDEAYVAYNQAQRAMLADGTITQDEYNANMKEADDGYMKQVGELDAKATEFQTRMIMSRYDDEIGSLVTNIDANMGMTAANMAEIMSGKYGFSSKAGILDYDVLAKDLGIDALNEDTRNALAELWEKLEPQKQGLEELRNKYVALGEEVPEYISEGIKKANAIGILSGDIAAVYTAIGQELTENQGMANVYNGLDDKGMLPIPIKEALEAQKTKVEEPVKNLYDYIRQQIKGKFAEEIDVEAKVNFYMEGILPGTAYKYVPNVKKRAKGGIVTEPELSWIGEAGYDESVIPIDGSQNAINLWRQTGEMLGVFDRKDGFHALANQLLNENGSGGGTYNTENNSEENSRIIFSPTIQVNGGSVDRKELDEALNMAMEEFESLMERYIRNKERFSFSS